MNIYLDVIVLVIALGLFLVSGYGLGKDSSRKGEAIVFGFSGCLMFVEIILIISKLNVIL